MWIALPFLLVAIYEVWVIVSPWAPLAGLYKLAKLQPGEPSPAMRDIIIWVRSIAITKLIFLLLLLAVFVYQSFELQKWQRQQKAEMEAETRQLQKQIKDIQEAIQSDPDLQ